MTCETIEPLEGLGAVGIGTEDAHEDLGRTEVSRYLHRGHGDHSRDAWILHALIEKIRDFFANGFSETIGTAIFGHDDSRAARTNSGARRIDQVVGAPRVRANSSVR